MVRKVYANRTETLPRARGLCFTAPRGCGAGGPPRLEAAALTRKVTGRLSGVAGAESGDPQATRSSKPRPGDCRLPLCPSPTPAARAGAQGRQGRGGGPAGRPRPVPGCAPAAPGPGGRADRPAPRGTPQHRSLRGTGAAASGGGERARRAAGALGFRAASRAAGAAGRAL